MKRFLPILIAAQLQAASSWYVDVSLTGSPGSTNGTSWANAWTNFSQIVWGSVNAGDTIWIAQGKYGYLNPQKGGTGASPITLRVSPTNANGTANAGVTNSAVQISYGGITLSGSFDDSVSNQFNTTLSVTNLQTSTNLGWHVCPTNSADVDGGGNCIVVSVTNDIRLLWLQISQTSDHQEDYGINYKAGGDQRYSGCEVGWCWIHNVGQDGIKNDGAWPQWFDAIKVHHTLIELTGDDGLEINSGFTIANCVIRNARDEINRGHPDGISGASFSWTKIYNNVIWGFRRSQCFYPLTFVQNTTNLWVWGNVVYWGDTNSAQTAKQVGCFGMEDLYWNYNTPGTDATNIHWRSVRLFNNTFACFEPFSTDPFALNNRYDTGPAGQICDVRLTNGLFINNVFYGGLGAALSGDGRVFWGTNEAKIHHNIGYSTNTNGKRFITSDGTYATGEALTNAGFVGNSSAEPKFISGGNPNWNYRVDVTDTAMRDKGSNLTAYVSEMSDLNVDIDGTTRGADGNWDIGAFEFATNTLLVWLRFTNDLSGGEITDSSGSGNTFKRFGVAGGSYPSNSLMVTQASTWLGNYTNGAVLAWEYYLQAPDPRADYENGTWAGLTNLVQFTNMPQMSWAFWCAADTNRANYSATVLSAGDSGKGVWSVGRWYSSNPTNNLKWTICTNWTTEWERSKDLLFPGGTRDHTWHHYAGTFSNGVCVIYFDGTNCGSHTLAGNTTNLTFTPSESKAEGSYIPWIGLGCRTHDGTPTIETWANADTDYPNNGWWSGGIGDVRIYNRVLSASEVQTIFNSGGGTNAPAPEPPAPSTNVTYRVGTLRVQTLRQR